MSAYHDGYNNYRRSEPWNLSESDRIDWNRGKDAATKAEADAQTHFEGFPWDQKPSSTDNTYEGSSDLGVATSAVLLLLLGIYILSQFPLVCLALCALLVLGLIGWLLVKRKGKWVAYGLLVISLLTGLCIFSSWVKRKIEYQAILAEQAQRKEEYARQIIIMHRADSILRVNRVKYPSLRASSAKRRSQKKSTKPHHSSRPTLEQALGIE